MSQTETTWCLSDGCYIHQTYEEGFDEPGVEADVGFGDAAGAGEHFVYEGEDGEVGDWFCDGGEAEEEDLGDGHG